MVTGKKDKKVRLLKGLVTFICVILTLLTAGLIALGINAYIVLSQADKVYSTAADLPDNYEVDCIVVLGAGLKADGTPNHMLEDRIKVAVEVLNLTGADYILMSGDRTDEYYDEPASMKKYAESIGVDPSKILVDNEGFSTYESITRVKDKFGFDNVVIITQRYHLYRALYIAERNDIEAIGVSANLRTYSKQIYFSVREIVARLKDFVWCM